MLTYRHTDTLEVVGFSYSNYVGCVDDTPKPGGPIDYRQPAETCVSHVMRPIHE